MSIPMLTIDQPVADKIITKAWLTWASDNKLSDALQRLGSNAEANGAHMILGLRIEVLDRTSSSVGALSGRTNIATKGHFYVYGTAVQVGRRA